MTDSAQTTDRRARLAILIPAYNPGERLDKTLRSIAVQDVDCEVFVVDDGSEPAIAPGPHAARHPLCVLRIPRNQGIAHALNVGLDEIRARGFEFIARQDVGDVDTDDRLRRQMEFLDGHPDVALVGASVDFVDDAGVTQFTFEAPQTGVEIQRKMRYSAAVVHPTCMFRTAALGAQLNYSESDRHAEDYELFFRILAEHRIANLPDRLVYSQYAGDGISFGNRRASLWSRLRIQLRYFSLVDPHSYLGVIQTLALFFIPTGWVIRFKRR